MKSVVISTPEHLHFPMAMAALKAGKNIYLEKPIAHTIEEGAQIVALAEKTGLVVQVGTQNRSNKLYKRAKEMVEQGMIGECHFTRAFWYRNFDTTAPVPAAWRYVIPEDASPENTDWKRFLEGAKDQKVAFDKHRYFQWRNYWDYSSGISTDLLVHQTDISNFVLGKTVPSSCVASGGIYMWTREKGDDREVPDTFSAVYEYPGQVRTQLLQLLRQRSVRLWRAVHGFRRHHRSDQPPVHEFLPAEVQRQARERPPGNASGPRQRSGPDR